MSLTSPKRDLEALEGLLMARRYRVGRMLGKGAYGAVYLATHELMHTQVAIKVMHPDLIGKAELVERFLREARATAAINHPNVCATTDIDRTEDDILFIVMEYLEGQTLKARLRERGRLSLAESLGIADQIAAGLARAHEIDIVHRDLKPDNIMLLETAGPIPVAKILDFGLAQVRFGDGATAALTRPGMVAGTPLYFSPEQCTGTPIDARSDIYTLGVLLYLMLTGRTPFPAGPIAEVLHAHAHMPPPSLASMAPDLNMGEDVERLVMRMLAKDPDQRFPSAAAVRDAFAGFMDAESAAESVVLMLDSSDILDAESALVERPKLAPPTMPLLAPIERETSPDKESVEVVSATADTAPDVVARRPMPAMAGDATSQDAPTPAEPENPFFKDTGGKAPTPTQPKSRRGREKSRFSLPRITPLKKKPDHLSTLRTLTADRRVWVGVAAVVVVLLVAIIVASMSDDAETTGRGSEMSADEADSGTAASEASLEVAVRTVRNDERVAAALNELAEGHRSGLEALAALQEPFADQPAYLFVLGMAELEYGRRSRAMKVFAELGELDARYIAYAPLADVLIERATANDRSATKLLQEHMDPALAERLARDAVDGPVGSRRDERKRAKAILDETEALGQLPEWLQLSIELRLNDRTGCHSRKPIVEAMRKLGDKRALPVLEVLAETDSSKKDCMKGEFEAALEELGSD